MIYNIEVTYYNYFIDSGRHKREINVFGLQNAKDYARICGQADNVLSVDVINCMMGEVLLSIENKKETWEAEE